MDELAPQMVLILRRSGQTLLELAPYVLLGVVAGELLRLGSWAGMVRRRCRGSPRLSVLAAVLLGACSPLCTYGTVPVVLQLHRTGVGLPPLVGFLSASALMNPQLLVLTWGGISPEMALARAAAVLLWGSLLGLGLQWLAAPALVNRRLALPSGGGGEAAPALAAPRMASRATAAGDWRSLVIRCVRTTEYVGFYVVLGVLLGAAVEVLVPGRWIMAAFKPGHWTAVLWGSLLGVPLYACGGGTIPLVRSLLAQGMSRGSALAFFLVGPATRPPALMALAAVVRPRVIAGYLALLVVYSVVLGTLCG
jgi:uncharacterized membrane protein YraQ (UPF0718 family)